MKKLIRALWLAMAFVGIHSSALAQTNDKLYVFSRGKVVFRTEASRVDSIAFNGSKTLVQLFDAEGKRLYSGSRSVVDSITLRYFRPVADVLDVAFKADGTAEDVSPMKNPITTPLTTGINTYYSNTYKRYVASFSNNWGGSVSGYYKIDYTNNAKFINAISSGHTLEAVIMGSYPGTIANVEAKPFSSMQAGGTGFLVSTISGSRKNELTFLPNVTTSGSSTWRWATSGVVPQSRTYYHVVGVWDAQAGTASIYVNGRLCNTVEATGSLKLPTSGATWFCLGGDPASATEANTGWNGDIVLARIYSRALTSDDVDLLWSDVRELQEHAVPDMVTSVDYMSGLVVKGEQPFYISAEGFAEGDSVCLSDASDASWQAVLPLQFADDGRTFFLLPPSIYTGQYRMTLLRGEQTQDLGTVRFQLSRTMPVGSKVIAHRGHWNVPGAAQNSRRSLQNAIDLNVYGSETDIWLTTDGHLMVNHDASFSGVTLETATYAQARNLTLSNGEKMPELKDLLDMLTEESPTKLIIEIKTHANAARGLACADSAVNLVRRMGLRHKVEYIAFSLDICKRLAQDDPEAKVAYLNGGLSPSQLHQHGLTGLDYTAANFRSNPTWVDSAHELGMTTNVWTIDAMSDIIEMNNLGIDYITTNNPEDALRVQAYYAAQQGSAGPDDPLGPDDPESLVADLLDVEFHADGTATDRSPLRHKVELQGSEPVTVAYNDTYQRLTARFANPYGGDALAYYKVDYAQNADFKKALASGHTLEMLFKVTYTGTIPNREAKPFSSMQAGGTGFLISTQSGTRKNEITFLPNVSTSGASTWRWATSGVVPESDVYYHVVGVWDKAQQQARIYVNGRLCNSVEAPGELFFPSNSAAHWFGIGADANPSKGEQSGPWEIVTARIYGKALTDEQVVSLWKDWE